jgi:hypothetical protein
MRIVTANGKKTVKMSKTEWTEIGKKAGWTKIAVEGLTFDSEPSYGETDPLRGVPSNPSPSTGDVLGDMLSVSSDIEKDISSAIAKIDSLKNNISTSQEYMGDTHNLDEIKMSLEKAIRRVRNMSDSI